MPWCCSAVVVRQPAVGSTACRLRCPARWLGSRSSFLFVDLAGQPKVTGSLRTSGYQLDARLVGSMVRLVVRSAPTLSFPNGNGSAQSKAANQRIVRQAPLTAWLPQYTITDGTLSSSHTVPCEQVSHPAAFSGASMLTVYSLDLDRPGSTADPQPISVAADGDTVYATADSLYIASNPDWYCCQATAQRTELHRFDISGTGQPRYLGSGSVPGRLLSQYSLSDYAGSLRIATTGSGSSAVYLLRSDTLALTGQLTGLGRNEQIYAVRFAGPMGYLVTFRQTDPLYVLDLHDPAAPKLAGELSLTGYSNYLHDAGDSRLIGVGQQAGTDGRVAGLQVSLFDVRTPAKPALLGRVVQSDAPGEQSLDPHAFLYWQPTGLVVVPVQTWTSAQSGKVLVLRVAGGAAAQDRVAGQPGHPRRGGRWPGHPAQPAGAGHALDDVQQRHPGEQPGDVGPDRLDPVQLDRACTISARIDRAISAGVREPIGSPAGPWIRASWSAGHPVLGQPAGPGSLGVPGAERADIAGLGGQRCLQRPAGERQVMAQYHHQIRPAEFVRQLVGHPDRPAQQCRVGGQRVGDLAVPDDTNRHRGPEHADHLVGFAQQDGLVDALPDQPADLGQPLVGTGAAGVQPGLADRPGGQFGDQAAWPAQAQFLPERGVPALDQQPGPAAAGQPGRGRVGLADRQPVQPVLG